MSTGKIVLGVLAGVAAGAVLGVLFAPAKGAATRKRGAQMAADCVDDMKETFSDMTDTISSAIGCAKADAMDAGERGTAAAATELRRVRK